MDAKITNSNENKANPVNYSTQGFTGDPNKDGKFWKKYVGGGVRIYYFDVNKESKKKYDNIIKSIRIRKLWRP